MKKHSMTYIYNYLLVRLHVDVKYMSFALLIIMRRSFVQVTLGNIYLNCPRLQRLNKKNDGFRQKRDGFKKKKDGYRQKRNGFRKEKK